MIAAREPGPAPRGPDNAPAVHVLIPTHTTRHLDVCLAGLGAQTHPARTVVLTCDTDDPAIEGVAAGIWPRIAKAIENRGGRAPRFLYTARPHQGEARLNQVRNNGLRALETAGPGHGDLVVIIDGDMVLEPDALRHHAAFAAAGYNLVIPYRINLDPPSTETLTADLLLSEEGPGAVRMLARPEWMQPLDARQHRYERQLWRRVLPIPLTKRHKPKVIGGHHAVGVALLRAINGYDEQYAGYGYDDDDLARRLHALRPHPRTVIAVREILAYHLWHPSRAPQSPTLAPGYDRFRMWGLPTSARHGWRDPLPQPEPLVRVIDGSG